MRLYINITIFKRIIQSHIRKRKVIVVCCVCAILFLIYQVIFYVVLSNETSKQNKVHPRDLKQKQINTIVNENSVHNNPKQSNDVPGSQFNDKRRNDVHYNDQSRKGSIVSKHPEPNVSKIVLIGIADDKMGLEGFKCKSGLIISSSKLNDDYCDCPEDGSDEPLTNACELGKFKCKKTFRHYPSVLPSSFVNDGVCDCCDGSDEWTAHVQAVTLPQREQDRINIHQTPCPDLCNK